MPPAPPTPASAPLHVLRVAVRADRLVCDIAVPDPRHRSSSPALGCLVRQAFPGIDAHTCVNERGRTFGDVLDVTFTPHVVEHAAIHLQAARAEDDRTFTGTSEWLDQEAGLARVELSYADDLDALRAFAEAVGFVNSAVLTCNA